jgi:EAL and modified HD-GYP domain-containing signal transduction protein
MVPRPPTQATAEDKIVSPIDSCFVARQPILTRDEKVFGYELLFRDGARNYFQAFDGDAASRSIVDRSLLLGFDALCDGHKGFINCTRDTLLNDYITLLPSSCTVGEVLETVVPDEMIIASCLRLKASGYLIALDDFTLDDPRQSLVDLADIIKVDLKLTPVPQLAAMMARYNNPGRRMLAEKVETYEEFAAAAKLGFSYFQGYFFRRPEMLATSNIPNNQTTCLLILQAVSRPELDLNEIETLLKRDPELCYRLLRYLNSVTFSLPNQIRSVGHALSLLGTEAIRRWMRLVALVGASHNRPSDLVLSALVRARFGELVASTLDCDESRFFLVGLLSLIDAILAIPMARALEVIPLDEEIKEILLGKRKVGPLSIFYQLMVALELGEWQTIRELAKQLQLAENKVAEIYWQAMHWARALNSFT